MFRFASVRLGSNNIRPAIIYNIPGAVDQVDGIGGSIEIRPGRLVARITIPLACTFNNTVIDGVHSFVLMVFESVGRIVSRDIRTVAGEIGNLPLAVGHCLQDKVFLCVLNGFFTTGKH